MSQLAVHDSSTLGAIAPNVVLNAWKKLLPEKLVVLCWPHPRSTFLLDFFLCFQSSFRFGYCLSVLPLCTSLMRIEHKDALLWAASNKRSAVWGSNKRCSWICSLDATKLQYLFGFLFGAVMKGGEKERKGGKRREKKRKDKTLMVLAITMMLLVLCQMLQVSGPSSV